MDLICQDSSLGFISKAICKKHSRHEDCVELRSWQICLQLLPQNKWIILRIVFFKCWLFFCHWNLQCQLVRALFTLKIIERWALLIPLGTVWLVWLGKKMTLGKWEERACCVKWISRGLHLFIYFLKYLCWCELRVWRQVSSWGDGAGVAGFSVLR